MAMQYAPAKSRALACRGPRAHTRRQTWPGRRCGSAEDPAHGRQTGAPNEVRRWRTCIVDDKTVASCRGRQAAVLSQEVCRLAYWTDNVKRVHRALACSNLQLQPARSKQMQPGESTTALGQQHRQSALGVSCVHGAKQSLFPAHGREWLSRVAPGAVSSMCW